MAGSGRRTFAPGEVLTASNVMNYLMDQSVMNFAGTAARGSAIGTAVAEGMVSYLADSNAVEVYDGSAWKSIYPGVGNVVQVVNATTNTQVNNATSTLVSTGLSASITPTISTSKIIVLSSLNGVGKTSSATTTIANFYLQKDGTTVQNIALNVLYAMDGSVVAPGLSSSYVETSGSTTARTFRVVFNQGLTAGTITAQRDASLSTMTILEVSQ